MKRITAFMLMLVVVTTLIPVISASGDSLYIIPDSNTRELTKAELWSYKYDTLMYAFNEIYARHGYKFEPGSRCYNWFTQMPWYEPNEKETSKDHSKTYKACSKIEKKNVETIKAVRKEMREKGTTNPMGKGMPTPPDTKVDKPRGFEFVKLEPGMKLTVYTAPSYDAYRANGGRAACNTNGAIYTLGYDGEWMLILYEANQAGQYRVGYVNKIEIKKGKLPELNALVWENIDCVLQSTVNITDDPAQTTKPIATLQAGTSIKYLTTMYNKEGWDYIETEIDGKIARGFIESGSISLLNYETDEQPEG